MKGRAFPGLHNPSNLNIKLWVNSLEISKTCSIKSIVIGSGFGYKALLDWGAVSHELGYSYIVFHREGYMGSEIEKHDIRLIGTNGRNFEGTKLVLQSQEHCDLLIECGYGSKTNSSARGTVRMDKLARDSFQLCRENTDEHNEQCVTMFSFGISTGFYARPTPPLWPRGCRQVLAAS